MDVAETPLKRGRDRPRKDPSGDASSTPGTLKTCIPRQLGSPTTAPASKRKAKASTEVIDLAEDDDASLLKKRNEKKRLADVVNVTSPPLRTASLSTAMVDLTQDDDAPNTKKRTKKVAAKKKQPDGAEVTNPPLPAHLSDLLASGGLRSLATINLGGASAAPTNDAEEVIEVETPQAPEQVLLGSFKHKIVGIQHYTGRVGKKEAVSLVRQPANQYDRNAIAVFNLSGVMVGHLPRDLAAVSAPFLDNGIMTIEGVCPCTCAYELRC
ncbi:hypothetical protein DYB32_005738 [Aphanomyces invadans]|uniref:HIRAN domain-containing protein n=1 Tax=Aphanomyces invadans TaxID=157072 RepID=A0A3R6YXQ1_9STRA|nr:hypothetical protein DYB32_005738 [Aphanomyces invadans]